MVTPRSKGWPDAQLHCAGISQSFRRILRSFFRASASVAPKAVATRQVLSKQAGMVALSNHFRYARIGIAHYEALRTRCAHFTSASVVLKSKRTLTTLCFSLPGAYFTYVVATIVPSGSSSMPG